MESVYFNQAAESQVLGIAMQSAECLRQVTEMGNDEFYFSQHRLIHEAICALAAEKTGVDLVTVDAWLTKHKKIEDVGGSATLVDIYSAGYLPSMVKTYLSIIHECYVRRMQRKIAKAYAEKLDAGDSLEEVRDWMLRELKSVKDISDNGLISIRDAAMKTYEQLEKDQRNDEQPTNRIFSGISTMDNKLGGLHGSLYVAIGARPSVGKSIFALTYCLNAAKQGKRVLLVSLEMDEISITQRAIASQGGGTLDEITSGHISVAGWATIASVIGPIANLPLWYSTTANTVEKIRRCAYELFENGGIDMIAVDYIQLLEAAGNNRLNRQEEISKISRGLRLLAAELKIPILVLTQLNRASTKGQIIKGKRVAQEPTMSEARESGAIEQDANIFMLLHDPSESEMRDEEEKDAFLKLKEKGMQMIRIIINKNRQGKRGRVTLAFDGDHMRFLPIVRNASNDKPY